jgi:hypothetical protein
MVWKSVAWAMESVAGSSAPQARMALKSPARVGPQATPHDLGNLFSHLFFPCFPPSSSIGLTAFNTDEEWWWEGQRFNPP